MNKAVVTSFTQMFELILTGVLGVTFVAMQSGKYTDIQAISEGNDAERDAIALANVLISHPSLSYSDGETVFDGVLDKTKLDSVMTKKSDFLNNWKDGLQPNKALSSQVVYPNSYALITVLDLESNDAWTVAIAQSTGDIASFVDCLKENKKDDVSKLFEPDSYQWEVFDISNCKLPFSSTIASIRGFPVAINYPEYLTVHNALIKVWMVEK